MVFSSLLFLFAYLPLVLICYYLSPRKAKNAVLFALSLLFYAWGEPIYLILMMLSITSAYLLGFGVARYRHTSPGRAKWLTVLSVGINLSFLFFFKYYNFFATALSALPFVSIPTVSGLRLPIGISFYTFQILSYTVDLYRGNCDCQRNYVSFGTYVTLFPQLIAGPIVRYREIDEQLTYRHERMEDVSLGIRRFCCGLSKKVLLGDPLAQGSIYFRSMLSMERTTLGAWMTVVLYTLHLYFDFSGYTDMALGLGRMLGFRFPENFNYPYIAKSISEFWRRWHISLSSWFREYVYIPLGGNRAGKWRTYRNLAIVWLLTGLWHGAAWTFVLWGVYFGVLIIAERAFLQSLLDKCPTFLRHAYTMGLVCVGFLIFSAPDLPSAWDHAKALFGIGCVGGSSEVVIYQTLHLVPLMLIAAVGATPLPKRWFSRMLTRHPRSELVLPPICACALVLCVAYLVDSTFSPFEYLNF